MLTLVFPDLFTNCLAEFLNGVCLLKRSVVYLLNKGFWPLRISILSGSFLGFPVVERRRPRGGKSGRGGNECRPALEEEETPLKASLSARVLPAMPACPRTLRIARSKTSRVRVI